MNIVYDGSINKTAFKDVLGRVISDILETDPDSIYLDADLMSCIGMLKYADAHPERAINCGISEANMIGTACGLSAAGFKPIAHTFGPFASRRVFDQIFLSGGYAKNNITVIGTDPGVTAMYNGGTHMPFEDVALYRTIPGATIIDITDTVMLEDILRQYNNLFGVKYLRVGRKNAAQVYGEGSRFEIGKGIVLRNGKDCAVFAAGIMVHEALQAAERLAAEGIEVAVIDMFTIKPLDVELVLKYAKAAGCIVTAENHNKIGGLYSAVCDALAATLPTPVEYVAVEDEFGEVGPLDYLQQRFGLTADAVYCKVKTAMARR